MRHKHDSVAPPDDIHIAFGHELLSCIHTCLVQSVDFATCAFIEAAGYSGQTINISSIAMHSFERHTPIACGTRHHTMLVTGLLPSVEAGHPHLARQLMPAPQPPLSCLPSHHTSCTSHSTHLSTLAAHSLTMRPQSSGPCLQRGTTTAP